MSVCARAIGWNIKSVQNNISKALGIFGRNNSLFLKLANKGEESKMHKYFIATHVWASLQFSSTKLCYWEPNNSWSHVCPSKHTFSNQKMPLSGDQHFAPHSWVKKPRHQTPTAANATKKEENMTWGASWQDITNKLPDMFLNQRTDLQEPQGSGSMLNTTTEVHHSHI